MISKHIFTSDVISGKQLWINGLNSTGDLIVASTNFDIENNLKVGEDLSIGGDSVLSGNANISGDLYVGQNLTVKGTTTTLDTVNVTVDDHNIELGSVDNPTNITAEGGGITLKGDQDKTFNWQANYNGSWLSSENLGVADGKYVFTDKVRARDGAGLFLEDDGGNGIFVQDGGDVGIGTANPQSELHIESNIADHDTTLKIENRHGDTGGTAIEFQGYRDVDNDHWVAKIVADHENTTAHGALLLGSKLGFYTQNGAVGFDSPRMTIDQNGKVGIGTDSPEEPLDVRGTIKTKNDSDDSEVKLVSSGGMPHVNLQRGSSALGDWKITARGNGSQQVLATSVGTSTLMTVQANGNVGIGTDSPGYKLHIVQSSGATGEDATPSMKIEGSQPRIWLREIDQTDLNTLIRNNNSIFEIDTVSDTDTYIQNRFAINHGNGNVRINDLLGIGKDPDGYHLDVAAPGASANGIRVQTNNASSNAIVHIGGGGSTDIKFKVDGEGSVTTAKDVTIGGNLTVNGTTTTVNSTTVTVDDKNIELGSVASPTNTTADGGGITLKGATDKEFKWTNASNSWNSSEHLGIADGKHLFTDKVRARDNAGLLLQDSNGNGIFVQDGGNVGIGTASPAGGDVSGKALEIKSSAASILRLNRVNGQGAAVQDFSLYAGSTAFEIHDNKADETRLVIKDGNVGIGTTSPDEVLHVSGTVKATRAKLADLDIRSFTEATAGVIGDLLPATNTSKFGTIIETDPNGQMIFGIRGNDENDAFRILTKKYATSTTNEASRPYNYAALCVESNGNVGIGTMSPSSSLHVIGATLGDNVGDETSLAEIQGARHKLLFRESRHEESLSGNNWDGVTYKLQKKVDSTNMQSINFVHDSGAAAVDNHIDLYVGGHTSSAPFLSTRFAGNGKVGIGTDSPEAKLHIAGNNTNSGGLLIGHASGAGIDSLRFYIDSNNKAHITRGVSEKMTIDSDGNLGIATSSPESRLHIPQPGTTIGGNDLTKGCILFGSSSDGIAIDNNEIIKKGPANDRDFVIGNANSAGDILLRTNQADRVLISNNSTTVNNVLQAHGGMTIATSATGTPELTLKRSSSTSASGNDDIVDIRVGDSVLTFVINNDDDGDQGTYNFRKMAAGLEIPAAIDCDTITTNGVIRKNGDTNTYLEFHSADRLRLVTGGVQQLEVTNSGLFIQDYIKHTGDDNTYFGFENPDQWRIVTGGGERFVVTNTAIALKRDTGITGDLTVSGDLTVNGDTVTLNTTNLEVEDKLVTVAKNATNAATANNCGLDFGGQYKLTFRDESTNKLVIEDTTDDTASLEIQGTGGAQLILQDTNSTNTTNQTGVVAWKLANDTITAEVGFRNNNDSDFTIRNGSGDVVLLGQDTRLTGTGNLILEQGNLVIKSSSHDGTLSTATLTANRAYTLPNQSGTVAMTSDIPTNNNQLTNGAGYLTAHPNISAASSSNNSGRTYIQDITVDSNGHVTGIQTATETVENTDTTYSAGSGLDLSGTTFSLETDLRGEIEYVGSSRSYIRAKDTFTTTLPLLGTVTFPPQLTFFVDSDPTTNDGARVAFQSDGDVQVQGDVLAFQTTVSDKKFKNNIEQIQGGLDKVKKLRGVEFDWNATSRKGTRDVGVIAQEVEEVIPEVVKEKVPCVGEFCENTEKYKTVDYTKLVPVLIEAIKDLSEEVEELKKKLS